MKVLRGLFIVICLSAAVLTGTFAVYKISDDLRGVKEFRQLKEQAAVRNDRYEEAAAVSEEGALNIPLEVDLDALTGINPDTCGWLYIPCLDISYPVMYSEDNEYYLHRGFDGEYLLSGTLFADMACKPDFTSAHSVIYGHSMTNGTMFGKLKDIVYSGAADKDPYFWIFTQGASMRYRIFAAFETDEVQGFLKVYDSICPEYEALCGKMLEASFIETETDKVLKSRTVTLVTCGRYDSSRLIVSGILDSEILVNK